MECDIGFITNSNQGDSKITKYTQNFSFLFIIRDQDWSKCCYTLISQFVKAFRLDKSNL